MSILSEQQRDALQAISEWHRSNVQVFKLAGHAGTGKTFTATFLAREQQSFRLCAPIGKAGSVLADKSGLRATTVHAAIHSYRGEIIDPKPAR